MAQPTVAPALAGMVAWVATSAFQFGCGISELNPLEAQFTCHSAPHCLGLSTNTFGVITAMFTVGGTLSSLACAPVARYTQAGRHKCLQTSAALALFGAVLLHYAHGSFLLGAGRFVQGLGAGIAVVQVPLYLQEIAPPDWSGAVGIFNQLAVVGGIFAAQALGAAAVGGGHTWRIVPLASGILAVVQLGVGAVWAVESPGWLDSEGAQVAAAYPPTAALRQRLWGVAPYAPLSATGRVAEAQPTQWKTDAAFRKGMYLVVVTQLAQQLSGVNAILYYSTGILSSLMPAMASRVGLLITVVNGVLTLPPIWLISEKRLGRKVLLVGSAAGMGAFCFVLAYSLTTGHAVLSAVAILCVIACFSMGLGPVPFVILPEVLPPEHVSLGSSLGLGVNWLANSAVAAGFPPLRTAFGAYDHHTGGLVFALLGATNFVFAVWMAKSYHYDASPG